MFSKITELLVDNYDIENTFLKNKELNILLNYLNSFNINYSNLEINYSQNVDNHIENISNFIQNDQILNYAKSLINETSIKLKVLNTDVIIRIFHLNDVNDNLISYLVYVITSTIIICKHNIENIEIIYYLCNHNKIMNTPYLKKENINSGYCKNISSTDSKIVIYRTEEILKVTIHEMIHGLQQDVYSRNSSSALTDHYNTKYNIKVRDTYINEAYTEIWANIIHSFLMSKLFNDSNIVFIIILQYEKLFCEFQCNKILNLIKKNKNINKYTNVLAYFIIRGEIFNNLTNFIKSCRLNNENYLLLINDHYEQFIISQPPLLHTNINYTNTILKNTARMSGFSIEF